MARGKKMRAKEIMETLATDASYRRKLFDKLCKHLRDGFSIDCFCELSQPSIEMCLKTYKDEFCEEDMVLAMREGKEGWESIGRKQSEGTCLGNSRSWYYNMCARYKWSDRMHIESEHKGTVNVNVVQYSNPKESTT